MAPVCCDSDLFTEKIQYPCKKAKCVYRQWQWSREFSYFMSRLHTFLFLDPKKQHCGAQDVDDADDS